jgi:hypothetical protein
MSKLVHLGHVSTETKGSFLGTAADSGAATCQPQDDDGNPIGSQLYYKKAQKAVALPSGATKCV